MKLLIFILAITGFFMFGMLIPDQDYIMLNRHLIAKKDGQICYKILDPYDVRGIYCLSYSGNLK